MNYYVAIVSYLASLGCEAIRMERRGGKHPRIKFRFQDREIEHAVAGSPGD